MNKDLGKELDIRWNRYRTLAHQLKLALELDELEDEVDETGYWYAWYIYNVLDEQDIKECLYRDEPMIRNSKKELIEDLQEEYETDSLYVIEYIDIEDKALTNHSRISIVGDEGFDSSLYFLVSRSDNNAFM